MGSITLEQNDINAHIYQNREVVF